MASRAKVSGKVQMRDEAPELVVAKRVVLDEW